MTSTTSANEVFKTDERGRVRVPPERREEILNEFERSGLSGMKFARLSGVKYATLANWVQKRRKARAESGTVATPPEGARPLRLFEAFLPGAGAAALVIELPGGGRLLLESPGQLAMAAELLGLLAQKTRRTC